jgi:hypothetical protein
MKSRFDDFFNFSTLTIMVAGLDDQLVHDILFETIDFNTTFFGIETTSAQPIDDVRKVLRGRVQVVPKHSVTFDSVGILRGWVPSLEEDVTVQIFQWITPSLTLS